MRGYLLISTLLILGCCEAASPLVTIHKADGEKLQVRVEVADTPSSRARGLMFRTELPEGTGMLFVYPEETQSAYWMRNTPIPLDMIFIRQGEVVDIIENAVPYDETPLRPDVLYTMTLEVPGGYAARHGVRIGARVKWSGGQD